MANVEIGFDYRVTIEQLGGFGALQAMVGGHTFGYGDDYIQFRFKGSRKMNHCKITLNELDLYDVEFWKIRNPEATLVSEHTGIYGDMLKSLFEAETGLYLSL